MNYKTTWNGTLFVGKLNHWYQWYLSEDGTVHYAINSILYDATLREKYIIMYKKYKPIKDVCQCNKKGFEGLLIDFSFAPKEIKGNFK